MRHILNFIFIFFLISSVFGQTKYERRINFEEFLAEMSNFKGKTYELKNTQIYYDGDRDSIFNSPNLASKKYIIDAEIMLTDCHIDTDSTPYFKYIVFNKGIIFKNITGLRHFNFFHCEFLGTLGFFNSTLNELHIEDSQIKGNLVLQENTIKEAVEVNACTIDYQNPNNPYSIRHLIDAEDFVEQDSSQLFFLLNSEFDLYISKCKFLKTHLPNKIISFMDNAFNEVQLDSCVFDRPLDFLDIDVENIFVIKDCQFNELISFEAANLPDENTNILFEQIAGKLCIFQEYTNYAYTAKYDHEYLDKFKYNYNELINVYNQLESIYQSRGDSKSFNDCYVEKKDLETRMLKFIYDHDPHIHSYFDWKMNIFLKEFCSYGTDPVQSLVISFYVILTFAFFYFIFPSEEDNLSRERLVKNMKFCVDHFKNDAKIAEANKQKQEFRLKKIEEKLEDLQEPLKSIPAFLFFLGSPLHFWYIKYYQAKYWLTFLFELECGSWKRLTFFEKLATGFFIGLYLLLFIAWGLCMRIINSFALSMNAFVTLGYGEISATGVSRYLAVIQGAVGWFLLSIFSVSLISQILA